MSIIPFKRDSFDLEPFFKNIWNQEGPEIHMDVKENDSRYEIHCDVPGADEKNIDISLNDNILTIQTRYSEEAEDKGENYIKQERATGFKTRSVHLPMKVDEDHLKAELKRGVLKITLPKSAAAKKHIRKVHIKAVA